MERRRKGGEEEGLLYIASSHLIFDDKAGPRLMY